MGDDNLLERVLASSPAKFGLITDNAEQFRFQALLSQFTLASGRPTLLRHGYRVDHQYFYPASAIKLCGVVAALCKLEYLQKSLGVDVSITTPLAFYPLQEGDQFQEHDLSNVFNGTITLANEIRKCLLISECAAFNRLYAFTGQRYINEKMWQLGLLTTRVHQRLSLVMNSEVNRFCQPIELRIPGMPMTLPPKRNVKLIEEVKHANGLKVGVGHIHENGEMVMQPLDFTKKNYISLLDLQNLLIKIFCPDAELNGEQCKLDHSSQLFLQETMAEYPSESSNPVYSKSEFPNDFCKFFLPGICRVRPKEAFRIYNKIGRAYGFTTENSYIFDKVRGEGFFLSAVIYTNSNGILNDDKYEYESIADCVLADLGEMVARAVWKIPPACSRVSSWLDCMPSSSLKESHDLQQRENASEGGEVLKAEMSTRFLAQTGVNDIPWPAIIDSLQPSSPVVSCLLEEDPSSLSGHIVDTNTQQCEVAAKSMCYYKYHLNE